MKISDDRVSIMQLLLATSILSSVTNAQNWMWSWKCVNEKCVKSSSPSAQDENYSNTLDVCRLTCGPYGALWPKPTGETKLGTDLVRINPNKVNINVKTKDNVPPAAKDMMVQMGQIFINNLKFLCDETSTSKTKELLVKIAISSSSMDLKWTTDESYSLQVKREGEKIIALIQAATVFGGRHGMETLFQLTTVVNSNSSRYLVLIAEATVVDKPSFSHRGLLLDTSRHFLSADSIKRTLSAMSHSKMNVFHWHATDTHSFPLELPRVPQMAKFGAYSAQEVYTISDIKDILEYAKLRGIRVIIEIDSPAHAGNGWQWGDIVGLGELAVCINKSPWRGMCVEPPCGQLNPANKNMYKILGQIFNDLLDVLPAGETIHMGGDEVSFNCWNSSTQIVQYMQQLGLGQSVYDYLKLWSKFHMESLNTFDKIVGHSDTPIILWSSHLTEPKTIENFLPKKRFIIQTWTESSNPLLNDLLSSGYRAIVSTKDAWYLDHGFWSNTQYYRWTKVYDNLLPDSKNVLGGEVCMWGEYVDEHSLDSRVWPRASAAGERLWSNPKAKSSSAALYRLLQHRERLVKLGVQAETVVPQWCYQNEDLCL